MKKLFKQFYQRHPVYSVSTDEPLHTLNPVEIGRIRRYERTLVLIASALSVVGFLAYYLPVYWYPELFVVAKLPIPLLGTVALPWIETLWCIALTVVELLLLTLLNIAGVHAVAIATGFISRATKVERGDAVLSIGLEVKPKQIVQFGIDPFQGLNVWALFLFNMVLRLKGWLGNRLIRFLVRLLLGRFAVRTVLDFAGMPLYMLINAISVHRVLREARVIIMGQAVIALLLERLPRRQLSEAEKGLLYDTLQYIAVSKRDFHENHYVLTSKLMTHFNIPAEPKHLLPHDYLARLRDAPAEIAAVCKFVILIGFILDGKLSVRERLKLRQLNRLGILPDSSADLKRYAREFLAGAGVSRWCEPYLTCVDTPPHS